MTQSTGTGTVVPDAFYYLVNQYRKNRSKEITFLYRTEKTALLATATHTYIGSIFGSSGIFMDHFGSPLAGTSRPNMAFIRETTHNKAANRFHPISA